MLFSCGEIHVFIGCRLQQEFGVSSVMLFYVWQCTVLTKVKVAKVNI